MPLTVFLLRYLRLIFQLVQGDVDGSVDGSDAGSVASGGRRTWDPRPVLLGVDNPLEVGFSRGTGLEGRRAQGRHVSAPRAARSQVWSLTQFYSVDFSKSRIHAEKCFLTKSTIKVCVRHFQGVLGHLQLTTTTYANLDCVFVEKALFYTDP